MKKLDVSSITDISQFPVKQGTLQFLQDAYGDLFGALVISLIGSTYSPTTMYVLNGVVNSGTAPAYNVTGGYVFFNGELFLVVPTSFTATGSNVAVFSILISQYVVNADPVTFTDLTVRNVHNIRTMQITQAASGSGLADILQLQYMSLPVPPQLQLTAPVIAPYVGNQLQLIGSYPNIIAFVPPNSNLHPVLYADTKNIGDLATGNNTINIEFASIGTGDYYVQGCIVSNPGSTNPGADSTVTWSISSRTDTGFVLTCRETTATVQDVSFEFVLFAK